MLAVVFLASWSLFVGSISALVMSKVGHDQRRRLDEAWGRTHHSVVAGMNRYIFRTEHHLKALQAEVARLGGDPKEIEARSCAETAPTIRQMIHEAIAADAPPSREELDS